MKLKEEKECLNQKIALELKFKENYFKMWQESEKEKEKLKTSRLAFYGKNIKHSAKDSICNEILRIPSSLLQDPEELQDGIIGKGRFGTVSLKPF